MSRTSGLETHEWSILLRLLYGHPWLFARGGVEMKLFLHLIGRTIWFHKFEERYASRYAAHGKAALLALPFGVGASNLRRAKCRLEAAGLFSFEKAGVAYGHDPWTCRVNVPGMVTAFRAAFGQVLGYDEGAQFTLDQLSQIQKKVDLVWSQNGWERQEVTMIKEECDYIEENAELGRAKAVRERKRRLAKIGAAKTAGEVRPGWIIEYMVEACEDLGIKYFEPMATAKERAKVNRCARNFVLYCTEMGLHPRDLIWEVCENWHRFRDKIRRDDGRTILLPEAVSFINFFRYREQITTWLGLRCDEDSSPQPRVQIIDLGDIGESASGG